MHTLRELVKFSDILFAYNISKLSIHIQYLLHCQVLPDVQIWGRCAGLCPCAWGSCRSPDIPLHPGTWRTTPPHPRLPTRQNQPSAKPCQVNSNTHKSLSLQVLATRSSQQIHKKIVYKNIYASCMHCVLPLRTERREKKAREDTWIIT